MTINVYGRTLPVPDREPSIKAALVNPASANIQIMQAQALRDLSLLSDKELSKFELGMRNVPKTRHFFNPFTGEYRHIIIKDWE